MGKILVADDDWPDLAPMLRKWLADFELIFEGEADRVSVVLDQQPDIDLVLLDLYFNKQNMQGRDVVQILKKNHPSVPIIVLSDETDIQLAQRLKEENKTHHYFRKNDLPHSNSEFVHRVENAVGWRVSQKELVALSLSFADSDRRVTIGHWRPNLTTMQYALYRTVAQAAREQWPGVGPQGFGGVGWIAYSDFFNPATMAAQNFVGYWSGPNLIQAADDFHEILVQAGNPERSEDNRDYYRDKIRKLLSPCISKINLELSRALKNSDAVAKFKIYRAQRRQGGKPVSTLGLMLNPTAITFQK